MKKKILVAVVLIIALASTIGLFFVGDRGVPFVTSPRVAVVRLDGPISETGGTGFLGGGPHITPRVVSHYLEQAAEDSSVKAVVLRINTPGGAVAASQEIGEMLQRFEKPVVVSMGDLATSGGYYISVFADVIVAQPGSLTGSIGVITSITSIQRLLEKLGIEMQTFAGGEHKDGFAGLRPLSDRERKKMEELTRQYYVQFIEAVAEGRQMDLADVQAVATGELFSGQQALELGLVDRLGGLTIAIEEAARLAGLPDVPATVEYFPPGPSLWQLLDGLLQFNFTDILETADIASDTELSLLMLLRTLEGWHLVPRY